MPAEWALQQLLVTAAFLDTCKYKPPPCPHVYVHYCDLEAKPFVQSVANGVFPEEALRDAARQFKQQLEKARVLCTIRRVAALKFPEIVRDIIHCTPAQGLSVWSYQALQLPPSSIPSCFTNCGEVALVALVVLKLTGAPANFLLIEISKLLV